MKPAWDKLIADFKDSDSAGVYDVDCTAAGSDLCSANGVRGYPTIKWGDPSALEDYEGGRSYEDLKKFADENLKPTCSPSNLDLCDDDKKAEIEKLQAMSADDLDKAITEKEDEIKAAEKRVRKEKPKKPKKVWKLVNSIWGPRRKYCDARDFYDPPEVKAKGFEVDWEAARAAQGFDKKLLKASKAIEDEGERARATPEAFKQVRLARGGLLTRGVPARVPLRMRVHSPDCSMC